MDIISSYKLYTFKALQFIPTKTKVDFFFTEQDVELPKLPLPLPKRPSGFVYNGGKSSAPVHLSAFLDLTCGDSQQAWPVIKNLVKSYGPEKLRVTVHFFALAYFYHAFITLKVSVLIACEYSRRALPSLQFSAEAAVLVRWLINALC